MAARFEDIPVTEIAVKTRTRSVSRDAVAVLRQSYEDHGGFTTPIHVRKAKTGFELIDGAHRLTLARDLGLDTILARVWQCSQEEARFFETDANLALAHLTPVALELARPRRGHRAGRLAGLSGGPARAQGVGVHRRPVARVLRAGQKRLPAAQRPVLCRLL
jgi:ParB family transcriptional regulator, chromosome partitioning protein